MLIVSHNGNPIIKKNREIKYTRSLNYFLNQNVDETKQANFATFALKIEHNLSLLQHYK